MIDLTVVVVTDDGLLLYVDDEMCAIVVDKVGFKSVAGEATVFSVFEDIIAPSVAEELNAVFVAVEAKFASVVEDIIAASVAEEVIVTFVVDVNLVPVVAEVNAVSVVEEVIVVSVVEEASSGDSLVGEVDEPGSVEGAFDTSVVPAVGGDEIEVVVESIAKLIVGWGEVVVVMI